jgi:hypothetical protein
MVLRKDRKAWHVLIACFGVKAAWILRTNRAAFGILHFLVAWMTPAYMARGIWTELWSAFLMTDFGGRKRRAEGAVVQAERAMGTRSHVFYIGLLQRLLIRKFAFCCFEYAPSYHIYYRYVVKDTGASEKRKKQRVKETTDEGRFSRFSALYDYIINYTVNGWSRS